MKWYEKSIWIVALLFLFFPVGCFLMWKYKKNWMMPVKLGISVIAAFWFLSFSIAALTDNSSVYIKQMESLETVNTDLTTQNTTLEAKITELQGELKTAENQNEELSEKLESANTSLASVSTDSTELATLKENVATLESQVTVLKEENAKLQKEKDTLSADIAKNSSKTASASKQTASNQTVSNQSIDSSTKVQEASDPVPEPVTETVLVTKTGAKYHKRKCGNGTYYESTLEEAHQRGLGACKKCY